MKNEKKEFDDLKKILEQKFNLAGLDGYVSIAIGEAYTKLWEKEKGLGHELPEPQRKAFLFTIAKNCILDELRRQNKLLHESKSTGADFHRLPAVVDFRLETERTDKIFIEQALNFLDEKKRRVIEMHYLEGYSVEEIAKEIGLSSDGVKKRLKEGMKELRRKLNEKRGDKN